MPDTAGPELEPARVAADAAAAVPPPAAARRELGGRLAGLSLPRQVFILAVWPFLEQVLNFLVGFTDQVLAGRINTHASNAMAVGVYVEWLIGLVQMAVGIGSSALVARAIGARHRRLANAALGQSLLLGLLGGVGIGALIFAAAEPIVAFTRLEGESLRFCTTYLRIMGCAAPFSGVLFAGNACLRGSGDTRTPFRVLVLVNMVNAGMSVLLVRGPAPLGGRGVAGIALGTLCAWACGAGLIVSTLLLGWGGLKLRLHRLRPHADTLRRILRVGLPQLAEALVGMWIANFVVLRFVGMLDQPAAWGAHGIAIKIEALSYLPAFALGTAAATLVGQYLGLGDPQRAARATRLCWAAAAVITSAMGLVFLVAPRPLVRMVTDQPELLDLTPTLLRIAGPFEVFLGTYIVLAQAMRGAGDTRVTLRLMLVSTFGVRLPLAYLMGIAWGGGLAGLWVAMCLELLVRGVIFAARFQHGGWIKARV